MNLDNIIRLILTAYREGWGQQRLSMETQLSYHDLSVIIERLKREGWDLKKGFMPFQYDLGSSWMFQGDFAVVGDVHVPFTHWLFSGRVAQIARRMLTKPRRLIIAGDFYNADQFSIYAQLVPPPTWQQERDAGRYLLKDWLATFDEIYMLMGNHDRRIQKATAGAFQEDDILALLTSNTRVKMSKFGYCMVDSRTGPWRVTHQKNYSVNQLVVADQLAQKFQCNIITHHEHHSALGLDRYKNFIVVSNGSLVDDTKLAYMGLDDTKSARMARSFTILRAGAPYLFDEKITDWDYWMGLPELK